MYPPDLESLLREITLSAIASDIDVTDEPEDIIFSLDKAVATRRIVACVQFEEIWEQPVDPDLEVEGVAFFFVGVKLSPEVCEEASEMGSAVNELSWTLLLPDVHTLSIEDRPKTAYEFLTLADIDLPASSIEFYEVLKEIIKFDDRESSLH